jgi:cell division protein FtsL
MSVIENLAQRGPRTLWFERWPSAAILVGGVLLMSAALFQVWVHLQIISVGYDISRQMTLRQKLTEANERLSLELRTRMDLSAVERSARDRYGMQPIDPQSIRVVREP